MQNAVFPLLLGPHFPCKEEASKTGGRLLELEDRRVQARGVSLFFPRIDDFFCSLTADM